MVVGFNPDYLMSGVDAIDADEVKFELRDPVKAVVLRGVGQRRLPVPADAARVCPATDRAFRHLVSGDVRDAH